MQASTITAVFEAAAQIRILTENGELWFVATDITDALGLDRTQTRRLDPDEKGVRPIHTPSGQQQVAVINESGLYSLVLGSRKPEAKRFKKWITSEVLPSIRKTGRYEEAQTPTASVAIFHEKANLLIKYKSHRLRIIREANEPWFIVSDLIDLLGLSNNQARVIGTRKVAAHGREFLTIDRQGVEALVNKSHAENREDFRRWFREAALPAILGAQPEYASEVLPLIEVERITAAEVDELQRICRNITRCFRFEHQAKFALGKLVRRIAGPGGWKHLPREDYDHVYAWLKDIERLTSGFTAQVTSLERLFWARLPDDPNSTVVRLDPDHGRVFE